MRKISTTLIIALLISSSLLAQKKKWGHFGLKTGLNFSTINVKDNDEVESKWKSGFVLGAFVQIPLSSKFSIQPEFLYSSMGGNLETSFAAVNHYRFNYFSIPVLGKIQVCKNFNALVGPQIDAIIQGKSNVQYDITNMLNEFVFSATGGVECFVKPSIVLGLRYMYGLSNSLGNDSPIKWINHGAQLTIGFKLN
jgi:Outer membrane protein beta-barrel domain